jgi:hypothetical protein
MTAFAGIIDPDTTAKQTFVSAVRRHFADHPLDVSDQKSIGELDCLWQTCRTAPISLARSNETVVYVLGHLDGTGAGAHSHAERIATHFENKGLDGLPCHSGFFVAVVAHGKDTFVFCDQQGWFPCYYATTGSALAIGTSSHIPGLHPLISRRLNKKALVAHLLCMHELLGESLWEGVRRLGAGEILHFADGRLDRISVQPIPVSDDGFGLPAAEQLERAHEAMLDAFGEYRGRDVSQLCSGGLDSRVTAAYLAESHANVRMVYTLGNRRDNDYRCARRAIGMLGLPHRRLPVDVTRFPEFMERQIAAEQLANGVNDLGWWSLVDHVAGANAPLVAGYVGDAIPGGNHICFGFDASRRTFSFEHLYRMINVWGLPEQTICELFPGDPAARWIAEIKDELRAFYDALPGLPFQKTWQFDLLHWERFHAANPMYRISHGLWPAAPLASSSLLKVVGSLPACSIMHRRLEENLLITRFPKLARIPVDTTVSYPRQLIPSASYRISAKLGNAIGRQWRRLRDLDNRYYYRLYSLDNAGWRQLRAQCHQSCGKLSDVLDVDRLRAIVPAPEVRVQDTGTQAQSGIKSLLAFVLWYNRYGDGMTGADHTPQIAPSVSEQVPSRPIAAPS